jgi:uncharacterized protein HemY
VSRRRTTADADDAASRLLWAGAVARLGDHAASVRIVEDGLARGESPALRRGLGDIIASWVDAIEKEQPVATTQCTALLDRGLRQCPDHPALLARVAGVLRADGPESRQARAVLEGLLTDGRAAPTAHYLLGADAHRRGRADEARAHFEQAVRLAPGTPIFANNLAWYLAEGPNADPGRALTLINAALARDPNEPRFRGTRGHVFVRLRRWKDAVADLEAVVPPEGGPPELRRDLTDAYEALRQGRQAEGQRRRAAGPAPPTAERSHRRPEKPSP